MCWYLRLRTQGPTQLPEESSHICLLFSPCFWLSHICAFLQTGEPPQMGGLPCLCFPAATEKAAASQTTWICVFVLACFEGARREPTTHLQRVVPFFFSFFCLEGVPSKQGGTSGKDAPLVCGTLAGGWMMQTIGSGGVPAVLHQAGAGVPGLCTNCYALRSLSKSMA